jgi:hypothetical protein
LLKGKELSKESTLWRRSVEGRGRDEAVIEGIDALIQLLKEEAEKGVRLSNVLSMETRTRGGRGVERSCCWSSGGRACGTSESQQK